MPPRADRGRGDTCISGSINNLTFPSAVHHTTAAFLKVAEGTTCKTWTHEIPPRPHRANRSVCTKGQQQQLNLFVDRKSYLDEGLQGRRTGPTEYLPHFIPLRPPSPPPPPTPTLYLSENFMQSLYLLFLILL